MAISCKKCGSMAINPHLHGRDPEVDTDLCDVCYWRKRADLPKLKVPLRVSIEVADQMPDLEEFLKNEGERVLCADMRPFMSLYQNGSTFGTIQYVFSFDLEAFLAHMKELTEQEMEKWQSL